MNYQAFIMNPNDAKRILIGAKGRLNPMEFAQGLVAIVVILSALNILSLIPGLGMLIGLLMIPIGLVASFAWVCIFSKRFHDAGKSGWMTLAAIGGSIVISFILVMILSPIFGVASLNDFSSLQSMGAGMTLKNTVSNILVNGALGYYMFNLSPVSEAASPSND